MKTSSITRLIAKWEARMTKYIFWINNNFSILWSLVELRQSRDDRTMRMRMRKTLLYASTIFWDRTSLGLMPNVSEAINTYPFTRVIEGGNLFSLATLWRLKSLYWSEYRATSWAKEIAFNNWQPSKYDGAKSYLRRSCHRYGIPRRIDCANWLLKFARGSNLSRKLSENMCAEMLRMSIRWRLS